MQNKFRTYTNAISWSLFFVLILAAWSALYLMAMRQMAVIPSALLGPGMPFLIEGKITSNKLPFLLEALCVTGPEASLLSYVGMWLLMSAAMMAPTAFPMLLSYRKIEKAPTLGFYALLLGYLSIWAFFSVLAAGAQSLLFKAELLTSGGFFKAPMLSALLLFLAGAYQFSSLKQACLNQCQSPMVYFLGRWQPGLWGAYRMGIEQGFFCLGCCFVLMALAFVGGTMNLLWMGIGMLLMSLEKFPAMGRFLTIPLGLMLILASLWIASAILLGL